MWAGIGIFILSGIAGMFGVISGMQRSFAALGRNDIGNPAELSHSISSVLHSQILFIVGTVFGLVVFTVSLVCFNRAGDANTTEDSEGPAPP